MSLVPRACPLCGSRDDSRALTPSTFDPAKIDAFSFSSRKKPDGMHHRLVECPGCGLLYATPAPAAADLSAAYGRASFDAGEESRFAARAYVSVLEDILPRLPDRAGALDAGAGDGAFLAELLDLGFTDVVGVEPSAAPIAAARPEIRPRLRRGMFSADDVPENSLSLFTSFQTLEHVDDPLGLCRGAFRLLKKGGAALFVGHDRRALPARLLGFKSPIYDIEHLQLFCPRTLERLLRSAGFSDVRVRPVWNRYPLHYWARLLPIPETLKPGRDSALGRLSLALPPGNIAAVGFKI